MDGIHYEDIVDRCIVKVKVDDFRDLQLFRVYSISKPMSGIVTVLAQHISYDLSGIPVKPFSAKNATSAFSQLKNKSVVDNPFEFWTNLQTEGEFVAAKPSSIRSCLGSGDGSILSIFGGEYEFDNYTVKLHNYRGTNRGVSIRYGKNLTNIKQDQNCSNIATGIYPYWFSEADGSSVLVELPEKIINTPGIHNFVKIITVDLSSVFDSQPSVEQLREAGNKYIEEHELGVPVVSMSISYAQLEQTEEYKHLKLLERVSLFDTVNVEFPALGVSATAKAVKIIYDVIADRVKSVTLGSVRANIADTIAAQKVEIEKKPSKTFMQTAIESLTKTILGARGGSVRFLDENGDGEPDTLYIADDPDPAQAVKVWRFNYEGWGASNTGYNGDFKLGASLQDGFVADFITAGTLYGLLIKAGTIESLDGKISIDLTSGNRVLLDSGITSNDLIIRSTTGEELLRVFVNQISDTFSDEYLSFVGKYRDGSPMFRMGTLGAVLPGENEKDVGSSIQLLSSSGKIDLDSNVNGSGIQLTNTNTSPMTIASILLKDDGNLSMNIGDDVHRNLSWEFSTELQKYILCGL
jgi:phage minor structural protein